MKVKALIPAKGTSQRLRRKNMVPLGGRPLIEWTIMAAKEAEVFDGEIYVCSEDDEILKTAGFNEVLPLRRPEILSTPDAIVDDVLKWFREQLEWAGPVYVLLPTSPFRTAETIRSTWKQYASRGVQRMMSLVPDEHPVFWSILWEGGSIAPTMPNHYSMPRSKLPRTFRHDGGHLIHSVGGTGMAVFSPPEEEVLDINTYRDVLFAEFLLEKGYVVDSRARAL